MSFLNGRKDMHCVYLFILTHRRFRLRVFGGFVLVRLPMGDLEYLCRLRNNHELNTHEYGCLLLLISFVNKLASCNI